MNDEWDRQKDIDAEGQRSMMVPRKPDLSNVGKATAYKMGYRQAQATLTTPDPRTAALVEALERASDALTHALYLLPKDCNQRLGMEGASEVSRAALAAWEA